MSILFFSILGYLIAVISVERFIKTSYLINVFNFIKGFLSIHLLFIFVYFQIFNNTISSFEYLMNMYFYYSTYIPNETVKYTLYIIFMNILNVYGHLFPFFSKKKAKRKALYFTLGSQFSIVPMEFIISISLFFIIKIFIKQMQVSLILSNLIMPFLIYLNPYREFSMGLYIYLVFFSLNGIMVLIMHKKYFLEWNKQS